MKVGVDAERVGNTLGKSTSKPSRKIIQMIEDGEEVGSLGKLRIVE